MIIEEQNVQNIRSVTIEQIQAAPVTRQIFQKLSKWVSSRSLKLQNFWDSLSHKATLSELERFFANVGFKVSNQDQKQLRKLFLGHTVIHIRTLFQLIQEWKQNQSQLFEFLRKKTETVLNRKQQKLARPASTAAVNFQKKEEEEGLSKQRFKKSSRDHLKQHRDKQRQIERLLALTIKKGQNQYQNEMLQKMGQANELSKELNEKTTYRAYKNAKGDLVVWQFMLDEYIGQKNLQQFKRTYNMIKKKHSSTREVKRWDVLSACKRTPPGLNVTDFAFGQSEKVPKKNIKKRERQEELRRVLNDTTRLTAILKEQLQILKGKGIYHKPA